MANIQNLARMENGVLVMALTNACDKIMQQQMLNPMEAVEVYMRLLLVAIADTCDKGRAHHALDGMISTMHAEMEMYIRTKNPDLNKKV